MSNLPSRASDAGPDNALPKYCPNCDSKNPNAFGQCTGDCGNTCCDTCGIAAKKGLYCAGCIKRILDEDPEEDWPELAKVEEVRAITRFANIPEWLAKLDGWVM